MPITESRLQSECYQWFHATFPEQRGRLFMVYNNPSNPREGAILKGMGMYPGVSDLIYLSTGLTANAPVFLELKLPGKYQSEEQKRFERLVQRLGFQYRIISSLSQFQTLINSFQ